MDLQAGQNTTNAAYVQAAVKLISKEVCVPHAELFMSILFINRTGIQK